MNSISLAFTIMAIISGISLFGVAFDSTMYNDTPKGHSRTGKILLITTLVFTFVAILTSGKGCNDYKVQDYEYGNVPIDCPAQPKKEDSK